MKQWITDHPPPARAEIQRGLGYGELEDDCTGGIERPWLIIERLLEGQDKRLAKEACENDQIMITSTGDDVFINGDLPTRIHTQLVRHIRRDIAALRGERPLNQLMY